MAQTHPDVMSDGTVGHQEIFNLLQFFSATFGVAVVLSSYWNVLEEIGSSNSCSCNKIVKGILPDFE